MDIYLVTDEKQRFVFLFILSYVQTYYKSQPLIWKCNICCRITVSQLWAFNSIIIPNLSKWFQLSHRKRTFFNPGWIRQNILCQGFTNRAEHFLKPQQARSFFEMKEFCKATTMGQLEVWKIIHMSTYNQTSIQQPKSITKSNLT